METLLFVVFGAVAVAGGLTVILARNPVYSALGLMATMFSLAVFYVVHLAHLIAAVQVIVYAGAVMTLFLFVIMLIGVDRAEDTSETLPWQRQAAAVVGIAVVVVGGVLAVGGRFDWVTYLGRPGDDPAAVNGTVQEVARELFSAWALPFEAVSLLLIVAAVGAIALAFFRPARRDRGDA